MNVNQRMVIVLGSANMDLVAYGPKLPAPGETVLADRFVQNPGGKGANQAVAAARAGARTLFAGAVGVDAFGDELLAALVRAEVEVQYVARIADEPTGVALITVDAAGRNMITVVPGANACVGRECVERLKPLLHPGVVVVMQLEIPVQTVTAMAEAASAMGATVVLNPAPARQLSPQLLACVTVLVPNEDELYAIAGDAGRTTPCDLAHRLLQHGVGSVVVTRGDKGVLLVTPEKRVHIPAHPVPAVDTTAAGDALVGALAAKLALGDSLESAVRFGNAAAALSVQTSGAQNSLPRAADVQRLLEAAEC
jgi:ribokinase